MKTRTKRGKTNTQKKLKPQINKKKKKKKEQTKTKPKQNIKELRIFFKQYTTNQNWRKQKTPNDSKIPLHTTFRG